MLVTWPSFSQHFKYLCKPLIPWRKILHFLKKTFVFLTEPNWYIIIPPFLPHPPISTMHNESSHFPFTRKKRLHGKIPGLVLITCVFVFCCSSFSSISKDEVFLPLLKVNSSIIRNHSATLSLFSIYIVFFFCLECSTSAF